jgi:hypothetical protein
MGTQGLIYQFIILRALVDFLGEKLKFGWWNSNSLKETRLNFSALFAHDMRYNLSFFLSCHANH